MRSIWDFIVKHEFWFTLNASTILYIGEYLTRTHWMGGLGFLLFLIAITRLASHPMWKKDKEKL
jgi:hypothetical protein